MLNKAFRLTALHNQARAHARVRPCIYLYTVDAYIYIYICLYVYT